MRLDENFKSNHNLAAWAFADELGDGAVCDREIIETFFALLQAPVANQGAVHRSNSTEDFVGNAMFWLKRGQDSLMPLVTLGK